MTNQTETTGNSPTQAVQKSNSNFITVNELAIMLRKSPSIVQKSWRGWVEKWGLAPIRFGGAKRGRLLFDIRDVETMLKKWSVPQSSNDSEVKATGGKRSIPKCMRKSK